MSVAGIRKRTMTVVKTKIVMVMLVKVMIFGVEREESGGNVGNNDDIWGRKRG